MTRPGPVIATRPAAILAVLEPVVEVLGHGRAALARRLEVADARPEVEDPLLEVVLLRLQVEGRRDQRRPLLARDPDPGALGRQLRGDQEPEREERDAEGDLPGRDGADARRERRHATRSAGGGAPPRRSGRSRRRSARRSRGPRPGSIRSRSTAPTTAGTGVADGVGAAASGVAAPALGDGAGTTIDPASPRDPSSPTAAARPGAGCGPYSLGVVAPRSASQPAWNAARSWPSACVNASSSVSPAEYALTRLTSASWLCVRTR